MSSNPITDMTVYCEKHDRKRWEFIKAESGRWVFSPSRGRRWRSDTLAGFDRATGRRLTRKEAEYAAVGEVVSGRSEAFAEIYTWRYNLECGKCRITVEARDARLDPIFDAQAAAGESSIGLAKLGVKLAGSVAP